MGVGRLFQNICRAIRLMSTAYLAWSATDRVKVVSEQELDALLRRLNESWREEPAIAELVRANGATLAIGLGRDETVLSLVPNPNPPYFASAGDPLAKGSMWFNYYGSPSEFPMSQAVDLERAVAAMKSFLVTGTQPDNVEWTQL